MNKFVFIFIGLITFITTSFAQINNDDNLFNVNEDVVKANEFIRVYSKNLDLVKDESQKDVDEYLKLFVNYKLKLAEAKALDFDKKPSYIKELDGYKKQLSKNFITETKVTDELVQEAYERISYDVNARHVLVRLDAQVTDTTEAYNKILGLRDRLIKEGFEKLNASAHDGNTTFVEDLGYFSGFKMVYDFEDYERYPYMEELVESIKARENNILYFRIDYDTQAKIHNEFVRKHESILDQLDPEYRHTVLPLFELSN